MPTSYDVLSIRKLWAISACYVVGVSNGAGARNDKPTSTFMCAILQLGKYRLRLHTFIVYINHPNMAHFPNDTAAVPPVAPFVGPDGDATLSW